VDGVDNENAGAFHLYNKRGFADCETFSKFFKKITGEIAGGNTGRRRTGESKNEI